MRKQPIYPFRLSMKHKTETGFRWTDRQPSTNALVALWDEDYGFWLYDYEQVQRRRCREGAILLRDQCISTRCRTPEELFLGDLNVAQGISELKFEWKPFATPLLKELLWRTFGSYSPLQFEAARVYRHNPTVLSGKEVLGTLKEIVSELSAFELTTNRQS